MKALLKSAITTASAFALISLAPAATTIYSEGFEDGTVSGWTDGAYSDPVNNVDTPVRSSSAVAPFNGTVAGLLLETEMFDEASNPSWAGTQVRSAAFGAGDFTGIALSDLTMGFQFAITADAGASSTVRFELREDGGITTHAVSVPVIDIAGGLNSFSFSMDNNQTGAFVTQGGFDALKTKRIYVQIQHGWALNGSVRDVDIVMDDFSIVAVPEPSAGLLGLVGVGVLFVRRRR